MKRILVVIDMQKDFIDGSLGTKEAESIVPAVVQKIRSYEKGAVFATKDTHEEDYMETQEGRNLPVAHCIRGTDGWAFPPEIQRVLEEQEAEIFEKPTFGSTALAERIKQLYEEEKGELSVELAGLCTDICVISNALLLKANLPELLISLDSACCAGVTPELHEEALATMKSCQIKVY